MPINKAGAEFRTSVTASTASDRLPRSFAPSTWTQPQVGATADSLELLPHTGRASASAPANSQADVASHHPHLPAGQLLLSMAPANADLNHATDLSQVQPQPGTVLVPNLQGVLLAAGPTTLWSQIHPHTAPDPQIPFHSSLVNNPQHATSTLVSAQMVHPASLHHSFSSLNPQLLQQPQITGPYASRDSQHQSHPQTAAAAPATAAAAAVPAAAPAAAAFPSFLPQLPVGQQLTAHPATAPAWAADHLQVLLPAQPETQLDPRDKSGAPSGVHVAPNLPVQAAAQQTIHPSANDAAPQPLQLVSNPQPGAPQSPAGLPPSGVQRPSLLPMPTPRHLQGDEDKSSAEPQAAASQLALQTEDIRKGVTALHMTGATPVAAPQATAAAQAPTAAAQAMTATAQAPTATAQPSMTAAQPPTAKVPDVTAAMRATAHHATDAAKAQPAPQLPSQQDDDAQTAPAIAPAPAAAASAAPVPTGITPDQARLLTPTTQKSPKSKKAPAHAGPKVARSSPRTGGAPTAGQTQLAAQASDSAGAASGSLQGYLAHASPGSISRLKQSLRRPPASARQAAASTPHATPVPSPMLRKNPDPISIPGQPVPESLLPASDTPMAAADEVAVQPAAVDAPQLQAVGAHTSAAAGTKEVAGPAMDAAAAATQEADGEAVDAAAAATQEATEEANNTAALQHRVEADSTAQHTQDRIVADTLRQWDDMRRNLFAYASQVPDPVVKQKLTDVLNGRPVSPMLSYKSDSASDSSSDSDAEPDQDTAGVLFPVLADVHQRGEAPPVRHSSNMPPHPSPHHPASDAQPDRQAQQRMLGTHSPPSSRLYPAQPSPQRSPAMRSVGQLHSSPPSSRHQPTRPDQATVLAQCSEQPASRKRGASSSDVHLASPLAPGML